MKKAVLKIDGVVQNLEGIAPNGFTFSFPNAKGTRVIGIEGVSVWLLNNQSIQAKIKISAFIDKNIYKLLENFYDNGLSFAIQRVQEREDGTRQIITINNCYVEKKGDLTLSAQGQESDAYCEFDIDGLVGTNII